MACHLLSLEDGVAISREHLVPISLKRSPQRLVSLLNLQFGTLLGLLRPPGQVLEPISTAGAKVSLKTLNIALLSSPVLYRLLDRSSPPTSPTHQSLLSSRPVLLVFLDLSVKPFFFFSLATASIISAVVAPIMYHNSQCRRVLTCERTSLALVAELLHNADVAPTSDDDSRITGVDKLLLRLILRG